MTEPVVKVSEIRGWPVGPLGVAITGDGAILLRKGINGNKRRCAIALGKVMLREHEAAQASEAAEVSP